ncbi:MAG TPA: amidohydrolase family protein [Gemmatimonadales bacterium]|nr:amidohydrolase family protein [Gemmatimonadales bacterium]
MTPLAALLLAALVQTPQAAVRPYVAVSAPLVALTHVRVIDGTGAAPAEDQTIVISNGTIASVGPSAGASIPAGAEVHDLTGRTVLPGLVMVHEHYFYPAGNGMYTEQGWSFPKLYLAGGVTTVRTGGSIEPYADLNLARSVVAGEIAGPAMDVTGPYLEGPGLPLVQIHPLADSAEARGMVEYWANQGATSFKAYMHVSRAELRAAIAAAHARRLKVTGHLCSVTFREAADLGIDDLEHGFLVATDFVPGKAVDRCPSRDSVVASLLALDPEGAPAQDLIRYLVAQRVALTSTLPVFETFTPGRPPASAAALDAMLPEARDQYLRQRVRIAGSTDTTWVVLLRKEMRLERRFAQAGGLLLVGTDPTGYGGVVAGFSNHRALELLVEAGFTPLEAIRIGTLNGATYLGRADRIGSIAAGKAADLVVVRGNPAATIADVEHVELVFRDGTGYDPAKLIAAARGSVGWR